MIPSELKIASISDIHLGHKKTPTADIIKNLDKAFPDTAETANLDIIFIVGDVFDTLLTLADPNVWLIKAWVANFLRRCKKYNILVRVLEGTPSHDWQQSEMFVTMNTSANINANLQYVKNLSIEHIPELDIHILYVPDEWEEDTEETLAQVRKLLIANGLTTVDYALMHGQFEWQLPDIVKAPKHNLAEYMKIVTELVFIGHVHEASHCERAYAQGSFDRLGHGYESPKGHLRAVVDKYGNRQVTFIENKGARVYKTIDCTALDTEQSLEKINKESEGLPDNSYLRIRLDNTNPLNQSMEVVIRSFPCFVWSKIVNEHSGVVTLDEEGEIEVYKPITITKDNIYKLLMNRIEPLGVSTEIINACDRILKEIVWEN